MISIRSQLARAFKNKLQVTVSLSIMHTGKYTITGIVKYMGKEKMHIGSRYFWGDFPEFEVSDKSDIYGKWKVSPGKMRPAIRSKIPESISRSFASAVIEKL